MEKLGIVFKAAQILKAEVMNVIVQKIDELVTSVVSHSQSINNIQNSEVDLSKSSFEKMKEEGTLDVNKKYYIYED